MKRKVLSPRFVRVKIRFFASVASNFQQDLFNENTTEIPRCTRYARKIAGVASHPLKNRNSLRSLWHLQKIEQK